MKQFPSQRPRYESEPTHAVSSSKDIAPDEKKEQLAPIEKPEKSLPEKKKRKSSKKKREQSPDHQADPKHPEVPKKREKEKEAKRAEVIEQSLAYKKQFEDAPIPRDPAVLARLLVADHVIALNNHLAEPDRAGCKFNEDELNEAIDYMGQVADKIKDPDLKLKPDIQEAYDDLIQFAEAALTQDDSVERILETNMEITDTSLAPESTDHWPVIKQSTDPTSNPLPESSEKQTTRKSPHILGTTATALIHALHGAHAQVKSHTHQPLSQGGGSTAPSPSPADQHDTAAPIQSPTLLPSQTVDNAYHSDTPHPTPFTSREIHRPLIRNPIEKLTRKSTQVPALLAGIAIAAALTPHRESSMPRSERLSLHVPPPRRLDSYSGPSTPHQTPSPIHHARPSRIEAFSAPSSVQHTESPSVSSYSNHETHSPTSQQRKLEHTPLLSLLTMATDVPVGHGKYLKEAYEKGHIDKDGLIKVLKARSKGRDFTTEYRQQASRYKQKRLSPEFLSDPANAINESSASSGRDTDDSIFDDTPQSSPTITPKPTMPAKIPHPFESLDRKEATQETPKEAVRSIYWILLGIAAAGTILWIMALTS